jgi:hypothetical protein
MKDATDFRMPRSGWTALSQLREMRLDSAADLARVRFQDQQIQ